MTSTTQLSAEQFRVQTISLVDRLTACSAALELGSPPELLVQLRARLGENRHRVLVLGEAKRGKSSFVNALIGGEVLPTAVEIATSQPFCVEPAETLGYRLRFEDGTAREISAGELAAYGSQVVADAGEGAVAEAPLRWIEVGVPARFVPNGIRLFDLPGLGGLYSGHAEITRRFVPLADAVIFVLDSGQPVGRREIDTLERLLEVTPRLFFIQTKIDQHSREAWEQTQRRNEEILDEHFGDRVDDTRVWPISSTNLLAAATGDEGSDALLFVSRYRQLAEALREFLSAVVEAPRAVGALLLAARYHQAGQQVLSNRLKAITVLTEQEAQAHRESVARRRSEFQGAWGEHGQDRSTLVKGVRRIAALSKQQLRESLQASGPIAVRFEAQIDAVSTVEEANALGATLASDVVAAGMDAWTDTCTLANKQYAALVQPLLVASENVMPDLDVEEIDLPEHEARARHTEDHLYDRLRGTFGYSMPMYVGAGVVITVIGTPIAIAAGAGGVLWAISRGWKQSASQKAKSAKSDLQRQLRSLLQRVSNHFLVVDLSAARYSRADEYFTAMETAMTERVDAIVKRHVDDLRSEIARLEAQAQLHTEERGAAAASIRTALAEWDEMSNDLGLLLREERCRAHLEELTDRAAEPAPR